MPRSRRRLRLALAIPFLCVVVPAACYVLDPRIDRVTIVNRSGGPVTDLRLDDRQFGRRLSRIEAGASADTFVHLDRDIHLTLTYRDAAGKPGLADADACYKPTTICGSIGATNIILYEDYASIVYTIGAREPTLWEYVKARLKWK